VPPPSKRQCSDLDDAQSPSLITFRRGEQKRDREEPPPEVEDEAASGHR